MEKSKLLKCPFCGGDAEIKDNGYVFWCECLKCGATGEKSIAAERARAKWNRRHRDAENGSRLRQNN